MVGIKMLIQYRCNDVLNFKVFWFWQIFEWVIKTAKLNNQIVSNTPMPSFEINFFAYNIATHRTGKLFCWWFAYPCIDTGVAEVMITFELGKSLFIGIKAYPTLNIKVMMTIPIILTFEFTRCTLLGYTFTRHLKCYGVLCPAKCWVFLFNRLYIHLIGHKTGGII